MTNTEVPTWPGETLEGDRRTVFRRDSVPLVAAVTDLSFTSFIPTRVDGARTPEGVSKTGFVGGLLVLVCLFSQELTSPQLNTLVSSDCVKDNGVNCVKFVVVGRVRCPKVKLGWYSLY